LSLLYSFPAIIIGLVHAYLPYMILTCYLSAAAIEDAYVEAARSLGARTPVVFWKVILPLSLPGLVSGSILIFVPVIGSFMEPRILGGRVGVTMGTVIEDQFVQAFNWPLGAALSFTMLAVVLMIFAASSRLLPGRVGTQ
jgi:spermidine/putrescine transport system permease protein